AGGGEAHSLGKWLSVIEGRSKAAIEAVAGGDRVYCCDLERRNETFRIRARKRDAFGAKLDDRAVKALGPKLAGGPLPILGRHRLPAEKARCFALIRGHDVDGGNHLRRQRPAGRGSRIENDDSLSGAQDLRRGKRGFKRYFELHQQNTASRKVGLGRFGILR